jgi:hypothetical protein
MGFFRCSKGKEACSDSYIVPCSDLRSEWGGGHIFFPQSGNKQFED